MQDNPYGRKGFNGKKSRGVSRGFLVLKNISYRKLSIFVQHSQCNFAIYFLLIKLRGFPVMNNLHVHIGRKLSIR